MSRMYEKPLTILLLWTRIFLIYLISKTAKLVALFGFAARRGGAAWKTRLNNLLFQILLVIMSRMLVLLSTLCARLRERIIRSWEIFEVEDQSGLLLRSFRALQQAQLIDLNESQRL